MCKLEKPLEGGGGLTKLTFLVVLHVPKSEGYGGLFIYSL